MRRLFCLGHWLPSSWPCTHLPIHCSSACIHTTTRWTGVGLLIVCDTTTNSAIVGIAVGRVATRCASQSPVRLRSAGSTHRSPPVPALESALSTIGVDTSVDSDSTVVTSSQSRRYQGQTGPRPASTVIGSRRPRPNDGRTGRPAHPAHRASPRRMRRGRAAHAGRWAAPNSAASRPKRTSRAGSRSTPRRDAPARRPAQPGQREAAQQDQERHRQHPEPHKLAGLRGLV